MQNLITMVVTTLMGLVIAVLFLVVLEGNVEHPLTVLLGVITGALVVTFARSRERRKP